jgi:S-(hydroxymethyl)glutathione dehydrogenase/alcohol dehydrogenase
MRAAVLRRTGEELEIVDGVGLVPLDPNDVRVAVRATGLCHSDLHGIDGDLGRHHPVTVTCRARRG